MAMRKSSSDMLRRAGKRVTPQRLTVLEAIRKSDGHLGADEIYYLARRQAPDLSLSTVYRTITMLKEAGIIEELHLSEEHHHYELSAKSDHHHLVCQRCGVVTEFDCPLSVELRRRVEEDYGFEVFDVRLSLLGSCPDCRRDEGKEALQP
jgi:Fur family ferric uptake transcriptional regulator